MGRPTKLTPVTQKRITDLIRKGVPRERAARLAGVVPSTFHLWMQKGDAGEEGYSEFPEAIRMAEDLLIERAVGSITDIFEGQGYEPSTRLNAAKFILSHRFPGEFSTRQEVRNTGPDGGPIKVEGTLGVTVAPLFSDEQLAAMGPEQLAAAIGALVGAG